jgi:PAS domain S-box-containing protein
VQSRDVTGTSQPRRSTDVVVVAEAQSGVVLYSTLEPERVVGRTVADLAQLLDPDGRRYRPPDAPLARAIATGEAVLDEELFWVMDGGVRALVRCSAFPLRDGAGRIVAGVLVARESRGAQPLAYHGSLLEHLEDAIVGTDPAFRLTTWSRGAERLYGYTPEEVLGRDAREVTTYAGDESRLALERELLAADRTGTELVARRNDGTLVDVELISVAVRDQSGAVSGYLGIHRDITERKRTETERERRSRRQALLADLGLKTLASEDLGRVMDEAVAIVADALAVDLVAVTELLAGGERLRLRAGIGWRTGVVGTATGPAGRRSLFGYTLLAGAPVASVDLQNDGRFELSPFVRAHRPASAATVIVTGRERPFGVLGAFSLEPRWFSDDDVTFLQTVANVISAAVERAGADRRLADVMDSERHRIARDLHDEALQQLGHALALTAGAGADVTAEVGGPMAEVAGILKRVGEQVRAAVYDLRLTADDDRPFPERLHELVEVHRGLAADCAIDLDLRRLSSASLGPPGTEVLRVVGEALLNARRHAGASAIAVTAWTSGDRLCVEVVDDGRGFDVTAPRGTGIRGMEERVELLGGELAIRSEAASGTAVRFNVLLDGTAPVGERIARVLLVEDHTAVREAIAELFAGEPDFEVVGQASTLAEARELLHDVDVAVIDLGLPDGYGGDLIRDLRATSPRAQALVLSATLDRGDMARAIDSGAAGTLDKTVGVDEIVDTIRRVRAGEALLAADELADLLRLAGRRREQERVNRQAIERLTRREHEVLQALAQGLNSQAIADRLHITLRTERNHVASILNKLGVHSQLQAVLFALRYGIVDVRTHRNPGCRGGEDEPDSP